jgi:hypothetical protein
LEVALQQASSLAIIVRREVVIVLGLATVLSFTAIPAHFGYIHLKLRKTGEKQSNQPRLLNLST